MAFTWRPPMDLKKQLQQKSNEMGIPMSNLLILICREYLAKEKEE